MSRDLTLLHPSMQEKWAKLVSLCAEQGYIIKNTSTYRDAEEQEDCVRRGTSSVHHPNSMHNWGVAVDFCRNDGTGAYNDAGGFFAAVGRIGESIGLIWGGSWNHPDKPHFQLADWGDTPAQLIAKYGTPAKFMATWGAPAETPPTTSTPQGPADADFKIGDEVTVAGPIYSNGRGGNSIQKNGDTMYIVDYAGGNYPYCWGVAKAQGGTRQGWAAPEILTLVSPSYAPGVSAPDSGSPAVYFPAAATYGGCSVIDGLKAVGADSSYAYRSQIAAANGISGYSGTSAQNGQILSLLKSGKLVRP